MVKNAADPDVLILGAHPCADLAAALLRQNSAIRVMRADVPGEVIDDRLVHFNAGFFDLHPLLTALKSSLELTPIYGLRFHGDDASVRSEFRDKKIACYVGALKPIRAAIEKLAQHSDCQRVRNSELCVHRLDENGVEVSLDDRRVKPKVLIIAGELDEASRRVLGLPLHWEPGVLRRYTYVKCRATPRNSIKKASDEDSQKPLMPMSLDLHGQLTWAWAMQAGSTVQFAVEQAAASSRSSLDLLSHWLDVLMRHGTIADATSIDLKSAKSLDLPLAGALEQEGVANRALLIGPAGGFYSACAEDIYPACWSAVFAAEAVKKALKEKHLQDALQPYRQKWGATLGDYLRGPQQNLRFLLPLVYKNKVMTARLAEAILFGKSVVR